MHNVDRIIQAAKKSTEDPSELSELSNMSYAGKHQDYSEGEQGFFLANWNYLQRLQKILKKLGYTCLYSDSDYVCECGTALSTEPAHMWDEPRYVVTDGAILCQNCAKEDDDAILYAISKGKRHSWFPYERLGYTLADEETSVFLSDTAKTEKDGSLCVWVGAYQYDIYRPDGWENVAKAARTRADRAAIANAVNAEVPITEENYQDAVANYDGWCVVCQDFTRCGSTEPDAEGYPCPECERNTCIGAETALISGAITF